MSDGDVMVKVLTKDCRGAWFLYLAFVTATLLLLSGCGFHLRGAIALPESLSSVSIAGTTEYSELGRALYGSLRRGGVAIVAKEEAALHIQILRDEVQRRVLSVNASGKANEYELKHQLRYSVSDREGVFVVPVQDISTTRAYTFDPNNLLATGDEEQKLRKSIIVSSAQQLLRQLSAAMRHETRQQVKSDKPAGTTDTPAPVVSPQNGNQKK